MIKLKIWLNGNWNNFITVRDIDMKQKAASVTANYQKI